MRAAIEASAAFDQRAGIGRYARNILSRLCTPGTDEWILLRAPEMRGTPPVWTPELAPNIQTRALPLSRRNADRVWHKARMPLDARAFGIRAEVMYSPDFSAPPMANVPRMITIHDLAFMTHPQTATDALVRYLNRTVPRQVAQADMIAVNSFATRDAVIERFSTPASDIVVARCGIDEVFYDVPSLSAADRARLGVPKEFLLMVGTIEPRKNHIGALRAIERAGLGRDMPLVVAGRRGWGFEEAWDLGQKLHAQGIVRMLEYVNENDLLALYGSARGVVYPSWTEGFGLPVGEALAAGLPVLTGTDAALREVGGPFADYAEPDDIDGLAEGMRRVAESSHDDAIRAQRQQWTRQFSWDFSTSTVDRNLRTLAMRSGRSWNPFRRSGGTSSGRHHPGSESC